MAEKLHSRAVLHLPKSAVDRLRARPAQFELVGGAHGIARQPRLVSAQTAKPSQPPKPAGSHKVPAQYADVVTGSGRTSHCRLRRDVGNVQNGACQAFHPQTAGVPYLKIPSNPRLFSNRGPNFHTKQLAGWTNMKVAPIVKTIFCPQ